MTKFKSKVSQGVKFTRCNSTTTRSQVAMGSKKLRRPPRSGVFNPNDAQRIKHTRMGVWDLYEEHTTDTIPIPGSSRLEMLGQILQGLPHVWRMLKDVCSVRRCFVLICLYLLVEIGAALIPAVSLWQVYSCDVSFVGLTVALGTLGNSSLW